MFSKKEFKNLIVDDIAEATIILLEDAIPFDNVETNVVKEHRTLTPEAEEFVDKKFLEIKKGNSITFNGIIAGLVDIRVDNRKVYLTFERSEFKYYLATFSKDYVPYVKSGEYYVLPIGVCGIVETGDNKILFVHPNTTNCYKTLGGYCDDGDFVDDALNLKNTFFRESGEELGDLHFYDEKILSMGKIGTGFTVLSYAKTDFTSEQIKQIRKENEGKLPDLYETENMIFVNNTPEDIGKFLLDNKEEMSRATRHNIKYYIKSRFSNYDYMTTR
jgi:hypothetical protein